jgi:hypothetical protein
VALEELAVPSFEVSSKDRTGSDYNSAPTKLKIKLNNLAYQKHKIFKYNL